MANEAVGQEAPLEAEELGKELRHLDAALQKLDALVSSFSDADLLNIQRARHTIAFRKGSIESRFGDTLDV